MANRVIFIGYLWFIILPLKFCLDNRATIFHTPQAYFMCESTFHKSVRIYFIEKSAKGQLFCQMSRKGTNEDAALPLMKFRCGEMNNIFNEILLRNMK